MYLSIYFVIMIVYIMPASIHSCT